MAFAFGITTTRTLSRTAALWVPPVTIMAAALVAAMTSTYDGAGAIGGSRLWLLPGTECPDDREQSQNAEQSPPWCGVSDIARQGVPVNRLFHESVFLTVQLDDPGARSTSSRLPTRGAACVDELLVDTWHDLQCSRGLPPFNPARLWSR